MGRLCQAGETGRRLTRVFFDADVVSSLQNVPRRRPRRTLTSRQAFAIATSDTQNVRILSSLVKKM